MVDTQRSVRLPSFKTRLALAPPENETCGHGKPGSKISREFEGTITYSGLDLETKTSRPPVEGEVFS